MSAIAPLTAVFNVLRGEGYVFFSTPMTATIKCSIDRTSCNVYVSGMLTRITSLLE